MGSLERLRLESWEDVLWHMEQHILQTDALLRERSMAVPEPWVPPEELGELPEIFIERAETLLSAQQELYARLSEARNVTGRQLAALRTVSEGAETAQPVYIDVTG